MRADERFFEQRLKLSHLRLVTLLASLGQVRLVAEHLHVTQPAVSKQLAELQAGLGGPIVIRVGNRLQFTAMGEALLRHAREVLLRLEQARHEVDALSKGLSGSLAIGGVVTVMAVMAPALVLQLKSRAPNLDVSLVEATSDRLFPMLARGELDLLFSRVPPSGRMAGVTGALVFRDPIVVACGRQHPLAARPRVVPADLAGMPWIVPGDESPAFIALDRWMRRHRLRLPPGCVRSNALSTIEKLLKAYPFLTLLSASMARTLAARAEVKVLALPGASFLGEVHVFHRDPAANPVVKAALECVEAVRQTLFEGTGRRTA